VGHQSSFPNLIPSLHGKVQNSHVFHSRTTLVANYELNYLPRCIKSGNCTMLRKIYEREVKMIKYWKTPKITHPKCLTVSL